MNIASKQRNIFNAQQIVGWIYSDLKWLTKKEIKSANLKRKELLRSLLDKAKYSFNCNKIHIGGLSPGCIICAEGYWSCIFINTSCIKHCFYCPQDRMLKKEQPPAAEGIIFKNPEDYADYLEKFNFKGVGFSGGEPLLVFEKLLLYIKKIRKSLGDKIYLWVYTNGSLIGEGKLKRLKEAGINEIRFNISAQGYNLHNVELAAKIINIVTVEIPCVPEDYKIVEKILKKLEAAGVKYLNIHQLTTTKFNYKNFAIRNYTLLHQPFLPVLESEIAALKLIKYGIDNKINLPINYCSAEYKNKFQGRGVRARIASLSENKLEELTEAGYIRSLSIQHSPAGIHNLVRVLQKNSSWDNLWLLKNINTELSIHSALLKHINFNEYNLVIRYFEPQLKTTFEPDEITEKVKLAAGSKLFLKKELVMQCNKLSALAIKFFQELFIENVHEKEVLDYFYRNYNLATKKNLDGIKREIELLLPLRKLERLDMGSNEIY